MKTMNLTLMLLFLAACAFAQNVPAYVPNNGLVGWWPFNGNANDESGNGNNGTVNGATLTSDRFGIAGKAYDFDGVNDYITINNTFDFAERSFNIWFSPNSISPVTGTLLVSDNPNLAYGVTQFRVIKNNNIDSVQVATGSQIAFYIGTQTNTNLWQMLTFTRNQNTTKIYYNGILISSSSSGNYTSNNGNLSTILGCDRILNFDFYNGKLDDIGIWNRALTQQEITNLYNGGICYQTITVTDTLLINTGITGFNPVTYENTIRIWPNPTYDHITIDAGDLNVMNGYSIRIVNALGQQMFQSAITQQQFYLDLSSWTGSGIYYVNIINAQGVTIDTRKIVLQ